MSFSSLDEAFEAGKKKGTEVYPDAVEEGDFDPEDPDSDAEEFASAVLDDMEENHVPPYDTPTPEFIKDYEDGFIEGFEEAMEKDCPDEDGDEEDDK